MSRRNSLSMNRYRYSKRQEENINMELRKFLFSLSDQSLNNLYLQYFDLPSLTENRYDLINQLTREIKQNRFTIMTNRNRGQSETIEKRLLTTARNGQPINLAKIYPLEKKKNLSQRQCSAGSLWRQSIPASSYWQK